MRLSVAATCLYLCLIGLSTAEGARASIRKDTNIPAEGLGPALNALAKDRDFQIVYVTEEIANVRTGGAVGEFTIEEAIQRLLVGTGLTFRYLDDKTVTIGAATAPLERVGRISQMSSESAEDANFNQQGKKGSSGNIRLAAVDTEKASSAGAPAPLSQDAAQSQIEEIVVTAEKRLENLQNVPSSVFVATAATLERAGVFDFEQIANVAPDLTVTKSTQSNNHTINIRGVGTYALSQNVEPSVVVVVDDIPLAYQSAAWAALPDATQVEVLRGPQSTLFGKSASAGVINITTANPTDHFTSSGEVYVTNDNEYRARTTIAGPITDSLKGLISANYSDYRGNVLNVYDGSHLNGDRDESARAKVIWNPLDTIEITLSPHVTSEYSSCCVQVYSALSPGLTFEAYGVPEATIQDGVLAGQNSRRVAQDVDMYNKTLGYGTGLRIAADLGRYTLLSITSADHYNHRYVEEGDYSTYNFQLSNPLLPAGGDVIAGSYTVNSLTEEVRLTSPSQAAFKYVSGLWFSRNGQVNTNQYGAASLTNGIYSAFNGQLSPLYSTTGWNDVYHSTNTNYAAFGDGTYSLSDAFSVIAGARVTHDENRYNAVSLVNGTSRGFPACSTTSPSGLPITTCLATTRVTGRFGLQYNITPTAMTFVSYTRGSKGRAFDLTSSLTQLSLLRSGAFKGYPSGDVLASLQPVQSTQVNDYEAGLKWQFFDRRVTWNTTAFYTLFYGFQAQELDPSSLVEKLAAVPKVTTGGVETEFAVNLPNFTLNGGGAYDKTDMNKYPGAGCFPYQTVALGCIGRVQDLSGKSLPNAPEWTLSLNGEYRIPFGTNGREISLTTSYRWQSQVHFQISGDPDSYQKAYGIANAGIGYGNHSYKIAFVVNNVFNTDYSIYKSRDPFFYNINPYGAMPTDAVLRTPARDNERYFGVRASFSLP